MDQAYWQKNLLQHQTGWFSVLCLNSRKRLTDGQDFSLEGNNLTDLLYQLIHKGLRFSQPTGSYEFGFSILGVILHIL